MAAIQGSLYREKLFREIINCLHQWPELERSIFCEAHYYGRSPETIAGAFRMAADEVRRILHACEQRLHSSLVNSLKDVSEDRLPVEKLAGSAMKKQAGKKAHARISSNNPISHFSLKSA